MSEKTIEEFMENREGLNQIVMKYSCLNIKRFYSLDTQLYRERALPTRTKELLGPVVSELF